MLPREPGMVTKLVVQVHLTEMVLYCKNKHGYRPDSSQ